MREFTFPFIRTGRARRVLGMMGLIPILFSSVASAAAQNNRLIAVVGGQVIDGTPAAPIRDGVVLIEGKLIRAVGPRAEVSIPRGAHVIDAQGGTVLPGLADLHTHPTHFIPRPTAFEDDSLSALRGSAILRQALDAGITLLRDTGARNYTAMGLKNALEEGYIEGPRYIICGNIVSATGGHGSEGELMLTPKWVLESDSPMEWRKHIRQNFKMGADYVKVTPPFTFEEIQLAVDEAHQFDARIAVDAGDYGYPAKMMVEHAVEAGADTLEHLPAIKNEAKVIEMIRERGIIVVPTLHARRRFAGERWLSPTDREKKSQTTPRDYEERFRKMHDAGILMALGTDTGGKDQGQIGEFYTEELKFFVEWGYEPHEVLQAATRIGAEAAGLADDLGTLEKGKLADVIVVPGNPLDDITLATRPTVVIKDGVILRQRSEKVSQEVTAGVR